MCKSKLGPFPQRVGPLFFQRRSPLTAPRAPPLATAGFFRPSRIQELAFDVFTDLNLTPPECPSQNTISKASPS